MCSSTLCVLERARERENLFVVSDACVMNFKYIIISSLNFEPTQHMGVIACTVCAAHVVCCERRTENTRRVLKDPASPRMDGIRFKSFDPLKLVPPAPHPAPIPVQAPGIVPSTAHQASGVNSICSTYSKTRARARLTRERTCAHLYRMTQ